MRDQAVALREFDDTTRRMFHDPDLTGDGLAVGLALARMVRDGEMNLLLRKIAGMLGWEFADGSPNWHRVRWVLADDRPRYVPRTPKGVGYCAAPMIRRDGECGQRATGGSHVRAEDGQTTYLPTCSRHRSWGINEQRKATARWQANGAPQPRPNAGGILARYFALDWETIYRWGDTGWVQPPADPPTRPRPTLRLVDGDGDGSDGPRPDLVLA